MYRLEDGIGEVNARRPWKLFRSKINGKISPYVLLIYISI